MNCLWCDKEMILEVNWRNIIQLSKPKQLCERCEEELELLKGERCEKCSRITKEKICSDCKWWGNHQEQDPLLFNHSVFTYNDRMQTMIAKWKYRGDYIVAHAFKDHFIQYFHKKFSKLQEDALIIPIPLSTERMHERGFNQAKVLANFLPVENKEIITRIHSEKQSKMTRSERISTENPFNIKEKINKKVILVDDIYTTGSTLRHAASLLKAHDCPAVYAYTLIRG